jgi:hypothetical protein
MRKCMYIVNRLRGHCCREPVSPGIPLLPRLSQVSGDARCGEDRRGAAHGMIQFRKVVTGLGDVFELYGRSARPLAKEEKRSRTYGPSRTNSRSLAPSTVPAPLKARI